MDARHPIGVVSARTGLPQDLIRAWERRYDAVTPTRSDTGRRLYTDEDIEHLKLLKRAVSAGRRISDVAALPMGELRELIAEDHAEGVDLQPRHHLGTTEESAQALLDECLDALASLDRSRLERALADASVSLSQPHLRRHVIVPLLHSIGDRWREGTLRIVHEHMASSIVRSYLDNARGEKPASAPRLIATTPSGELHELGALMAAAAADEIGWNTVYLGPNTPAEEIAAGVRQLGARAVALSVAHRDDEHRMQDELRRLRGLLPDEVPVFVGGRGVAALGPALEADGVYFVADLPEFQDRLSGLER